MRDAVQLARKGIPTVTVITDRFWDHSELVARAEGMPAIPRIEVPYPIAGTGPAAVAAAGRAAAPDIHRALLGHSR